MSMITHVKTLINRHKMLDEELQNAYTNRLPATEITRLKKLKLRLKDNINSLLASSNDFKNAA